MTQMNEMSVRALTMEELEDVNGGRSRSTDSYKKCSSAMRLRRKRRKLFGY